MVPSRALLPALVLVLLVTAPSAGAQTTQYGSTSGDPRFREDGRACWGMVGDDSDTACVVLYAHIIDLLNTAPLTTQRPPDHVADLADGFGGHVGAEPLWDLNELVMRPSPGMVEYDESDEGGDARVHPEHGLALDPLVDPHVPIHAYWYMSSDMAEVGPLGLDPLPDDPSIGTLPCLTVRMTIETGRWPGEGIPLTQGEVTKTVVTGTEANGPDAEHDCPGARTATATVGEVVEFHVEMPPIRTPVTASDGWVMKVEWWNFAPGDPDEQDKVYLPSWNVHTGPRFAPRVILPLQDPIHTEVPSATFVEGQMMVATSFQSTLGAYDVDPGSIQLQVFNADGQPVRAQHMGEPILTYPTGHDGGFRPLTATVPWAYEKEDLLPGAYTLRMSASNWQWSSEGSAETVVVLHAEAQESPPVGPVLSLLPFLLLWAFAALRRPQADHRNP